ncbi:thiol-disulfide oxidoreductase DCC family protein [Xanthocytophaga agilis]|uniref:DCC1-like thiol-disulfide oxidoreductase family protein n=1 Tax=Xanthocytophaga agilis TaxID=3048010 RepID=A0AAE3RA48_9BACT|nr:DCC1-like thiol-disulfide oxidoreductase family protein [Xanthocytophaga agilis]MDJ1504310.1 DCC1-like thiol-disulfide oxidoreductase family protein [Xanthocytophaga agilis]
MKAIIVFDGDCVFCNKYVQFVLNRDEQAYFNFASLRSEIGERLLEVARIGCSDGLVLFEEDRKYVGSEAALRICRHLQGGWPILFGLIYLPRWIRDGIYRWFARQRYLQGENINCLILTPGERARFIE